MRGQYKIEVRQGHKDGELQILASDDKGLVFMDTGERDWNGEGEGCSPRAMYYALSELFSAKARIAELEALITDIKTWDINKAAEEIARGQDLNLQVPPEIRKRMQATLDAGHAKPEACQ